MRKELSCPLCKKVKLKRLSNHLETVHKLSGLEKIEQLNKARQSYIYTTPMTFMEFFLSLKKIPLTVKEYKLLHRNPKQLEKAWDSKSIQNLPVVVLKMLKEAHERSILSRA